jgi:hypothetical protein
MFPENSPTRIPTAFRTAPRAKEPFAPGSSSLRRTKQAKDICFDQPQIAQMIDREIVRKRARQNNATNAAGRGARYAIDDDPQTESASD